MDTSQLPNAQTASAPIVTKKLKMKKKVPAKPVTMPFKG